MGLSMGVAGVNGMLRRMLYVNGLGPFQEYMNVALIGAIILASGYGVFLLNIVRAVGFKTLVSIFYSPHKRSTTASVGTQAS
jgi:heme/copper-type cytochrome/quinol oxidase subunit 1